mmetsp:Transcript_39777/g.29352  ORF Transcript_39777/g.29352 Transcript_39777/m.29352 type:complete len:107 (+) Transcript_39777:214-534(+)
MELAGQTSIVLHIADQRRKIIREPQQPFSSLNCLLLEQISLLYCSNCHFDCCWNHFEHSLDSDDYSRLDFGANEEACSWLVHEMEKAFFGKVELVALDFWYLKKYE